MLLCAWLLFILCLPSISGTVCFQESTSKSSDDVLEGKECVGPCMSREVILQNDPQRWFISGCGRGPVRLSDIIPAGRESLFDATEEDIVFDVCEGLGFGDVQEMTCTEDVQKILQTFLPPRFHALIESTLLPLISTEKACCCPSNLCNSVPVPLPEPRIECYQSVKSELSSSNSVSWVCPGSTCSTCEIVTKNGDTIRESAAQGCGFGSFSFNDFLPREVPLLGFDLDPIISDNLCLDLGLAGDELTCIDDPEALLRAGPEAIQPLVPAMLRFISSLRICCCGTTKCNTVPTPPLTVPVVNKCYKGSKDARDALQTEVIDCPGPCITCNLETNENLIEQQWLAQGCGAGPFLVADLVPFDLRDALGDATLDDACKLLGLADFEGNVCVDDPQTILRAILPTEQLRRNIPFLLGFMKSIEVCCCSGDLCNELPPVPTPPQHQCIYNAKSIPPNADSSNVLCPGACMSCEIVTRNPTPRQEFTSQGCGSGVIPLATIVPPQMLLAGIKDEIVTDPCALLQLAGEGLVCENSPKKILRAFLPTDFIRRSNLPSFLSAIDEMRVCCCLGDNCNVIEE